MNPDTETRDVLFKAFGGAFFRKDFDAMYDVVTDDFTWSILVNDEPVVLNTRPQVEAFLIARSESQSGVRFDDVVYHHAPDATFMTYRMSGTDLTTGDEFNHVGVERYTFRDGRIAEKDVYFRPVL